MTEKLQCQPSRYRSSSPSGALKYGYSVSEQFPPTFVSILLIDRKSPIVNRHRQRRIICPLQKINVHDIRKRLPTRLGQQLRHQRLVRRVRHRPDRRVPRHPLHELRDDSPETRAPVNLRRLLGQRPREEKETLVVAGHVVAHFGELAGDHFDAVGGVAVFVADVELGGEVEALCSEFCGDSDFLVCFDDEDDGRLAGADEFGEGQEAYVIGLGRRYDEAVVEAGEFSHDRVPLGLAVGSKAIIRIHGMRKVEDDEFGTTIGECIDIVDDGRNFLATRPELATVVTCPLLSIGDLRADIKIARAHLKLCENLQRLGLGKVID